MYFCLVVEQPQYAQMHCDLGNLYEAKSQEAVYLDGSSC